jgi:LmbE family N-acetylglucosaminyl deacetylase
VGTLVCFHAHPDDECMLTGGTIARAAAEGHRVVLVVATDGAHGEVPDDLVPGESLVDRRRAETERSAAVLGVARLVWLGYHDSGMTGWAQNDHEASFWRADVDDAARRLATVLQEERADVLTVYDWHGGYGHPDHIQVHRVGHRAAQLAGVSRLYEATMNRDLFVRLLDMAAEMGVTFDDASPDVGDDGAPAPTPDFDPSTLMDDGNPFGTPDKELHLRVDVSSFLAQKRAAIACHASQVTDSSMFLRMPEEIFALAFGAEWFIEPGVTPGAGPVTGWLFP